MSHIWTFSPSSEALIRRCIEAAATPSQDNKWFRAFGKQYTKIDDLDEITALNGTIINQEANILIQNSKEEDSPVILTSEFDEKFFSLLEAEPTVQFALLVEECLKDQNLITIIAQRLSNTAVEKICDHLFTKKDMNVTFLEYFYQIFFPSYLKRDHSWFALNLLVKSNIAHPLKFRKLLKLLLKDLELPNKVLHDFVQTLDQKTKLSFINNLIEIELSTKEFSHNLLTIYTVYKDCKKTEIIQSYILYSLIQNSEACVSERNYGRLLQAFLQAQKTMGPINECMKLEKIIETHRTPFKKPCIMIFKEILEKYNS